MSIKNRFHQKPSDNHYQGIADLVADAVIGVTDIVEHFHYQVLNSDDQPIKKKPRLAGVSGAVYHNIRQLTYWTNQRANFLIKRLENKSKILKPSPRTEAIVSAVNGVLGDHLLESNNPLAIAMRFKHQGFTLSDSELLSKIEQSNGKLLIMIHGSCMNDLQWFNKGSNQAEELADDLEAAALYVHYNSGLHISENGKTLSSLFEKLTKISSRSLEITILAHSMGGLVSRSACYYEEQLSHNWKTQIKSIIFLGTPHHGAPLEKAGNWVDHFLSLNSYMAPLAAMAKIRSCGITDLRYGNIIDEDWRGECRFKLSKDKRSYVNLPESIKCFSIAASTNKNVNKHSDNLIGDGLVSLNSALGKHLQFDLNFPQDRLWIARNMNHMDLLSHKAVFQKIRSWV